MPKKTEEKLAKALKELMAKEPLEKITVSEITDQCGVNRQTFYYHFHDIYELVEWYMKEKIGYKLEAIDDLDTWQHAVSDILVIMKEDKSFITQIFHSRSRDLLDDSIHTATFQAINKVMENYCAKHKIKGKGLDRVAYYYAYAISGFILQWIGEGMVENPEDLIKSLTDLTTEGMRVVIHKHC